MNVYDFDKTIFKGDSTEKFYFFCLKRCPKMLKHIPATFINFIKYAFGKITKTQFKEVMYRFLLEVPNVDAFVKEFWEKNKSNIYEWYLETRREDDVVISASPEFLLEGICRNLGIGTLMASRVDKNTGKYDGENCHGKEKVLRFRERFGNEKIHSFYSDSLSDTPLAEIAQDAHIVTHDGHLIPWETFKPTLWGKIKKAVLTSEFVMFALIGCVNVADAVLFEYLMSLWLGTKVGFIAGYLMSISLSFVLNSKFNFRTSLSIDKYLKFLISYIPNFLLQNVFVTFMHNTTALHDAVIFLISALVAVPVTYLLVSLFAFRRRK